MGRIRTIKPSFFKHSDLFEAEKESGLPLRLAYQGLWCVADREGRFKWRPREIKIDVLPYDEVDFAAIMDALATYRFILKYKCAGEEYGYIPSFATHQHVNPREAPSVLPEPGVADAKGTRKARATPLKMAADPCASKRPGHIYLALSVAAGRFKVGFAEDDPARRVKALSAGSAEELELIESFPAAFGLESEIHQALKPVHSRREWFVCGADAARLLGTWFRRAARVADATPTRLREEGVSGLREQEGKGREGNNNGAASAPVVVEIEIPKSLDRRKKPEAHEMPIWLPQKPWNDFCEMRVKIRHQMTDAAKALTIRDLSRLREKGHDPTAVLEQSTQRGWRGVFEIGEQNGNGKRRNGRAEGSATANHLAGIALLTSAARIRDVAGADEDSGGEG